MDATRKSVLLVDDNLASLTLGKELLKPRYTVYSAPSAERMFYILKKLVPDVILLDIDMPDMNGYEAIQILKATRRYAEIPVVFLTSKYEVESETKGFDLGASDYIIKPFAAPVLIKRIENQILIAAQQQLIKRHAGDLSSLVSIKDAQVHDLQNAAFTTLANLVELRDKYTVGHVMRIKLYFNALVEELFRQDVYTEEISQWNLDVIAPSVLLYDIGKIAIPDNVLNKPGKLDPRETEIMRTHVELGVDALTRAMSETSENEFLRHAQNIVACHHENWDGKGYPRGLRGERIPLEARLVAIASVYDALISWRPYRSAYSHSEALQIIKEGAWTQFDPDLVEVFLAVEYIFQRITNEYAPERPQGEILR